MGAYKIFFKKSVEKDLNRIGKNELKKIIARITALADNPRPPGCEKLTGLDRYRIRHGRNRILYSIQDHELTIWGIKVAHRKDAYKT
ncbi:MAG: type II toxin-antitoxin system RelE family toxin [Bacillota bacterium]